jgi:hypothetical protein
VSAIARDEVKSEDQESSRACWESFIVRTTSFIAEKGATKTQTRGGSNWKSTGPLFAENKVLDDVKKAEDDAASTKRRLRL